MGRGTGSAGAGDFVKYFLWAALLALAGCAHTSTRIDSGGSIVTTTTGFSASFSGQASPAAWALIGIGVIAWGSANSTDPPAPMDAGRRVNEVDCTKPIQDWSANLKCR
jgi:hypothetical protein